MTQNTPLYTVAAFYLFTRLDDIAEMKPRILAAAAEHEVKGTLLLAEEGINATVAAPSEEGLHAFLGFLRSDERMAALTHKISYASEAPFKKMKVKLRPEIIRLDDPATDAANNAGAYIEPQAWDALLEDGDIAVIDTRNEYETRIGSFKNAVIPDTRNFRDFPAWAREWAQGRDKEKKVAMFCTGGIRCEKSTAFMKTLGFTDVVHLNGGILRYLEDTGNASGAWQGACFVFDDRAAVNSELAPAFPPCERCGAGCTADSLKHGVPGKILCETCLASEPGSE